MTNKLLYIILCIIFGFYVYRYNQMSAIQCGPASGVNVSVKLDMSEPVLDTSLSLAQIMNRYRNYQKAHAYDGNTMTMGLTEGNWNSQYKIQISEHTKTLSGQKCLVVDWVDVTLHLEQVIFLADSMIRDKCHIKALMDHEMLHATVNRDITKESVGKLEKVLQEGIDGFGQFQGWGPYPAEQSSEKRRLLEEYIKRPFDLILDDMQEKGNRLNSEIDSPDEYDRVARRCSWQQ